MPPVPAVAAGVSKTEFVIPVDVAEHPFGLETITSTTCPFVNKVVVKVVEVPLCTLIPSTLKL